MPVPVAAITAAIELAAAVASNPEALDKAAELANSATKVIDAGAKTAETAATVIGPVATKAVSAGVEAGSKAADSAGKAIFDASKIVGGLFDSASAKRKDAQEARAKEKALMDARSKILAGASASFDAFEFEKNWESACEEDGIKPLKSPGYYAIATYKSKPGKDATAGYEEIFMARSEDMGASVHRHFCGEGNPDVYADVKHGKAVRVYAFPDFDDTDDNNETLQGFIVALGANESYNAKIGSALNGSDFAMTIVIPHTREQEIIDSLKELFPELCVIEKELCGNGLLSCKVQV